MITDVFCSCGEGRHRGLRRRVDLVGGSFFDSTDRGLHAPLALVNKPLGRILSARRNVAQGDERVLIVTLGGSERVLGVLGGMLEFSSGAGFLIGNKLGRGIGRRNGRVRGIRNRVSSAAMSGCLGRLRRRGGGRGTGRRRRRDRGNATSGGPDGGLAVLIIRSGSSLHLCLGDMLRRGCGILLTRGNGINLCGTHARVPSFVLASMAVPIVSNVAVVHRVGRSHAVSRVPVVVLSTGTDIRSRLGKFRRKISNCLAGPFSASCLVKHVRTTVGGHGTARASVTGVVGRGKGIKCTKGARGSKGTRTTRVFRTTARPEGALDRLGFSVRRGRELTRRGGSRLGDCTFVRDRVGSGAVNEVLGCIASGVNDPSLGVSSVTSTVNVDQDMLCGGVGRTMNVAPVSFIHRVQVVETYRLLRRAGSPLADVTFRMKFDSPGCFSGMFGGRLNVIPDRCHRQAGRWDGGERRSMFRGTARRGERGGAFYLFLYLFNGG